MTSARARILRRPPGSAFREGSLLRPRGVAAVSTEDWAGLIVVCSGTSWDGARLSDRHLAERMTKYAPVLFVDPPISWATPLVRPELRTSAYSSGLSLVGPRLARLTPLAPPGVSRRGLRILARVASRSAMSRACETLGGDVHAVIVGSLDDQFGACGERLSVLWGTDDFAAAGSLMGLSTDWLVARERQQLARANVVTAVSAPLAERWRAMGHDVTVIPNGVDTDHYARCEDAPAPPEIRLRPPIATFVGHLSDRIEIANLEAVARRGHSLLLVGPRQSTFEPRRLDALLQLPNVQWVGPQRFEDLPSYLRVTKVGLTPYADSQFNRASFPLKTLEYLAAGKRAVSTSLPSARALDTELVTIARDPVDFANATTRLLSEDSDAGAIGAAREFAKAHDWNARTRDMALLLGLDTDLLR